MELYAFALKPCDIDDRGLIILAKGWTPTHASSFASSTAALLTLSTLID